MTEAELVDVVHSVAFATFWLLLFAGALSPAARVAYYHAHGYERPRLLNRDIVFIGGMATSFGIILFARAVDIPNLRDSLPWALVTDAGGIIAVVTYVYFELFVIERGGRKPPH